MIQIDDLLGVPYKDHGRDKSGYDCYGLAIEVARRFGYKLDDVYYENHNLELSAEYIPTLNTTPRDTPDEGVLIEMQYKNEIHIGVCLNGYDFIHATRNGVRVNKIGTFKIRGYYGINSRI